MHYDVIGIGIPYVDRIVPVPFAEVAAIQAMTGKIDADNLILCEALAQKYGAQEISGGPITNTLTGLAALGARCGHIGVLGDDAAGTMAKNNLAVRGIDHLLSAQEILRTPIVYACVDPFGERHIVAFPNDAGKIAKANLPSALQAKIIFCHLRFLGREKLIPLIKPLLEQARMSAAKIIYSLQHFKRSDAYTQELMQLVHDTAHIVIGNEEEVEEFIISLQEKCPAMIVKTMGAAGVEIIQGSDTQFFPTEKIDTIVDAIGAGDQFAAGFIFGQLHDQSLAQSVAQGFKTARAILEIQGGQPSLNNQWQDLIR